MSRSSSRPPAGVPAPETFAKHPHDSLVKWAFKKVPHAEGLLRVMLPAAIVAAVDWGTLEVVDASFVDEALKQQHSDLVLKAKLRGSEREIYFYTLLEAQRESDAWMPLRMGKYLWRLWDLLAGTTEPGELPVIVPLVLFHGRSRWRAARSFQELVALEGEARAELAEHTPHFTLRILELDEEELRRAAAAGLTALGQLVFALLLSAGDDEQLRRLFRTIGHVWQQVLGELGVRAVATVVMRYVRAAHPRMTWSEIMELTKDAAGPYKEELGPDLFEEMIEVGRVKGRAEGRAEALLALVGRRFGAVGPEVVEQIRRADEARLEVLTLRVLDAATLEEFLREP